GKRDSRDDGREHPALVQFRDDHDTEHRANDERHGPEEIPEPVYLLPVRDRGTDAAEEGADLEVPDDGTVGDAREEDCKNGMETKNPPPTMTEKMPTTKPPTRSSAVWHVSSQGASALFHESSITVLHPARTTYAPPSPFSVFPVETQAPYAASRMRAS